VAGKGPDGGSDPLNRRFCDEALDFYLAACFQASSS
jgi:hypothetical protein